MEILNQLWENGFKAETLSGKRVNFKDQLGYARKNNFNLAIFTGEKELNEDKLIVISVESEEKKEIKRNELISFLNDNFKN